MVRIGHHFDDEEGSSQRFVFEKSGLTDACMATMVLE